MTIGGIWAFGRERAINELTPKRRIMLGQQRRPYRAWGLLDLNPGRRSQTRFALGYHLSGFQPFERT